METDAPTIRCFGCGGLVPQMEGPTHRYMLSSPGCWHVYGQVLVRDYTDPTLRDVHRLTVDSYAVQHPGQPTPQAIQSVCVHLMSLCLVVERGLATSYATRVMGEATKTKGPFSWLTPPASLGGVTVVDVAEAAPAQYPERVRAWAEAAWSAWAEHHPTIRGWLRRAGILSLIASTALAAGCSDSASVPTPQPTPIEDSWFTFVVQCAGCPGLTNAAIDRAVTPHRARLRVGQLTSLRAASRDGCEAPQNPLQITRWTPGDPSVLKVEPSGSESAIVTALAPGLSSITVERQLTTGGRSERGLRDAQITAGCGRLPEVVFEIVP